MNIRRPVIYVEIVYSFTEAFKLFDEHAAALRNATSMLGLTLPDKVSTYLPENWFARVDDGIRPPMAQIRIAKQQSDASYLINVRSRFVSQERRPFDTAWLRGDGNRISMRGELPKLLRDADLAPELKEKTVARIGDLLGSVGLNWAVQELTSLHGILLNMRKVSDNAPDQQRISRRRRANLAKLTWEFQQAEHQSLREERLRSVNTSVFHTSVSSAVHAMQDIRDQLKNETITAGNVALQVYQIRAAFDQINTQARPVSRLLLNKGQTERFQAFFTTMEGVGYDLGKLASLYSDRSQLDKAFGLTPDYAKRLTPVYAQTLAA